MPTVTTRVAQTFKKPNIAESYGPFASLQAAMTYIENADIKCVGLTVGIDQPDGSVKEYWLQPVEGQLQFVEKGGASGNFVTEQELQQGLSGKQDTINDLSDIRSGASAGATAVQPSTLNNYVQKSQTTGLLKNDGTVDTQTAGKAASALQPKQSGQYTQGDIVIFDENGGLADSQKKTTDFATAAQGAKADTAVQNITRGGSTLTKENGVVDIPEEIEEVVATPVAAGGSPTVNLANGTLTLGIPSGADAVNPFKGWFKDTTELNTAYSTPSVGDYAYVKNSGTPAMANIYSVVAGEWTDTNIVISITDMESVFPIFAKLSLISTLEKVAWIDGNGQNYLDDLRTALFGNVSLVSISASFNPGTNVILDTMSLDDLKDYLTVTATFSDGTQESVSGYQLSGMLSVGTNTITVAYLDETDTFTVTVKHNYAGALNTWTLHPQSGVAEYVNGYVRMKCVTSAMQSGYSVWGADASKSTWGAVNGKKLRVRIKVNTTSQNVGIFGLGIYSTSSPTTLGNTYARRTGVGDLTLADDGYYEYDKVQNLADFTYGTYTPTNNSSFGLYCYAMALNDYIEIYDVQIFEVE